MLHNSALKGSPQGTPLRIGKAELALIGVTMLWGGTFLIVHQAMLHSGPLFFVGLRFATAALVTALAAGRALKGVTREEWIAGVAIGVPIFLGYSLQSWGLQTIPSTTSAFITACYVPLVPLFQWLILRRAPGLMSWVGVAFAFAGLLLVAGPQDGLSLGVGEWLTLISTLAIALEIVLISRWAGKVDVLRVTTIQLGVTAALSFAMMVPMGEAMPSFSWFVLLSACGLGVASALIQIVMNWAQRTVSATRATVIYAGEPVWAGIIGRIAGDRLPPLALLGGVLIVVGVIASEVKLKRQGGE